MNYTQDDIDRLVSQKLALIHWEAMVKMAAAEAERDLLKREAAAAQKRSEPDEAG